MPQSSRCLQIATADPCLMSINKDGRPDATAFVTERLDQVPPHDGGAVQTDEKTSVQTALHLIHRGAEKMGAAADVNAHIVALGLDPLDRRCAHAHQVGAMRHPKMVDLV